MQTKGVLFDFSGTLFRIEPVAAWLRGALAARGSHMEQAEFEECVRRLTAAGALPGGPPPESVPPELAAAWTDRDSSAELHREAYTGLARRAGLPDPALGDALYERHMSPEAWRPYPDAAEVLRGLRRDGVAVGVVSNIGWDLRPVFRAHGLDELVDAYVLSYEHGVQKPDPRLFGAACALLGHDPSEVVMVGDDRRADAGAAALGCDVRFVDPLPVTERPDALRALGLPGTAGGTPDGHGS
ncbi:HAD family hydrolase [Streptomyces sp. NPDC058193]|uniref:HAD family hydrolase n=1 Tax=Streptomyces sp. NPDC058193 TaxID=3346373 RepID=UPI0036E61E1B